MGRFADLVLAYRRSLGVIIVAVTLGFGWEALHVEIGMDFGNLLPQDHEFVRLYERYKDHYGSPATVFVMVRVKEGDIYNAETLRKIRDVSQAIDALPAVNHDQVISIASRKVKKVAIKGNEISVTNLMAYRIPSGPLELRAFRDDVASAGVLGTLVSQDGRASLIAAQFLDGKYEFQRVSESLQTLKALHGDARHEIYVAGQPVLMGWVATYLREILWIILLTFAVIFGLTFLYIRDLTLTALPLLTTLMSVCWGLGFAACFGWPLDPLILIVPVLLIARTLSHGLQRVERIVELEGTALDPGEKAKALIRALFGSGVLGIVTDAIGILVIAIASIPLLQRLAYFGSFWALSIIVTVLIFLSIVVSYLGGLSKPHVKKRLEGGWVTRILDFNVRLVSPRRARSVLAGFVLVSLAALAFSLRITIGDVHPGTSLLWADSPFNTAVRKIGEAFHGADQLQVIVESHSDGGVRDPRVLRAMLDFQRTIERNPHVRATSSYADFIPLVRRQMNGNHVKWEDIPHSKQESLQYAYLLLRGTDPGDFRRFVSDTYDHASITLTLGDHRAETLESVVRDVRGEVDRSRNPALEGTQLRMAAGLAGVLAAVNEEVKVKQLWIFVLASLIIASSCFLAFRSWLAVAILMAPLLTTNFVVMSIMVMMQIGLDVNTLPIVSVGMGVGIDYGIYLLTRILQELPVTGRHDQAVATALRTTGRAIFFTASIMVLASGLWYFLSSFRFLAEMGLLLALIMGINMIGALVVIPACVIVFQPRLAKTPPILAWE